MPIHNYKLFIQDITSQEDRDVLLTFLILLVQNENNQLKIPIDENLDLTKYELKWNPEEIVNNNFILRLEQISPEDAN